ncbi:MAG: hypothetical protein AB8H12_09075, partial [Lewinella sp.]
QRPKASQRAAPTAEGFPTRSPNGRRPSQRAAPTAEGLPNAQPQRPKPPKKKGRRQNACDPDFGQ